MDIGEMKDKALAGLDKVVDSGKGLAGRAADRAKTVARAAKLRTEISTEKENLRKTYLEMGKLYYDVHKDDPEGFFIQLCDEVALSEKNIADKEAEIEALRSGCGASDAEIEVDFERRGKCGSGSGRGRGNRNGRRRRSCGEIRGCSSGFGRSGFGCGAI